MKKYVFVMNAIELLQRLVSGKRVEGVLYVDGDTGRLTFKAYNRTCLKRRAKDRLIRLLEHGWVKESAERIKVYESIPKNLGTARVMAVLDRESDEVKEALIDREIIEFV
jgi:hypothetical protein